MSKADANKKNNGDVLRANDIIPPYNKNIPQEQKPPAKEETSQYTGDKVKHTETLSTETENTVRQKTGIPKFDLAKQIMSEQRKVASIKRKSPGTKNKATILTQKARSIGYAVKPLPMLSHQEQIIAEIVQRDIKKLKKR